MCPQFQKMSPQNQLNQFNVIPTLLLEREMANDLLCRSTTNIHELSLIKSKLFRGNRKINLKSKEYLISMMMSVSDKTRVLDP